ncbi:hypothetical protein [Psychrobacter sp. FME13]|uniref:hypothetical protein n=1 Tax=unclassified Psychrobacter TaxID=196806 RepID=UPI0017889F61|nr:hypothetical protein [Psychrobacter sp. FME13]MBE0441715.1 hypothetical protein [Psychrobacter sp. FME13]
MALSQFFMPSSNLVGEGALEKGIEQLGRVLNSIDSHLNRLKMAKSCQTASNS